MPDSPDNSPLVHVAAALLVRDGKILAAERSHGPHRGFEFPGGKVEPGETALEACRREVREELGIEIQGAGGAPAPRLLARVRHDYEDFPLLMDVFLASPAPDSTIRDSEHPRLLWLGRDEVRDVDWLPADVALLEMVREGWDEIVGSS